MNKGQGTMLRDYIPHKSRALQAKASAMAADPTTAIAKLSAVCKAGDGSGVRVVKVREHKVISDSAPGIGGWDLGPGAPELLLTALASCLTHTYLMQAALNGWKLDEVEVTVECDLDMRGVLDQAGYPQRPTNIRFAARVRSPEPADVQQRLKSNVERTCPLLNALRMPMEVVDVSKNSEV